GCCRSGGSRERFPDRKARGFRRSYERSPLRVHEPEDLPTAARMHDARCRPQDLRGEMAGDAARTRLAAQSRFLRRLRDTLAVPNATPAAAGRPGRVRDAWRTP